MLNDISAVPTWSKVSCLSHLLDCTSTCSSAQADLYFRLSTMLTTNLEWGSPGPRYHTDNQTVCLSETTHVELPVIVSLAGNMSCSDAH